MRVYTNNYSRLLGLKIVPGFANAAACDIDAYERPPPKHGDEAGGSVALWKLEVKKGRCFR
jgi:hypothetical protein